MKSSLEKKMIRRLAEEGLDHRYSFNRMEIYCSHGIGHTVEWSEKTTHGCDGCCQEEDFEKAEKIVKTVLEEEASE